jgi:hypothetical protein
MLFSLFYLFFRLRLGTRSWVDDDRDTEILVLRHQLRVLR